MPHVAVLDLICPMVCRRRLGTEYVGMSIVYAFAVEPETVYGRSQGGITVLQPLLNKVSSWTERDLECLWRHVVDSKRTTCLMTVVHKRVVVTAPVVTGCTFAWRL